MKKNLSLILVLLFVIPECIAQNAFVASPIENRLAASLNTHFREYSLFRINTSAIKQFAKTQKAGAIDFELRLPGLDNWNFSIEEHDILSKDYTTVVQTERGKIVLPKPDCMTYWGYLSDVADSRVSLTLTSESIYGIIKSGNTEYFIEPLNYFNNLASPDLFVIYNVKDVIANPNLTCGVTEIAERRNTLQRTEAGLTCVRTELAIASDATMITRYLTIPAVVAHNVGVMNNVIWDYINNSFAYNIEFSIVTQSVSLIAATDQLTPAYAGTMSGTILANFKTWGEAGGFGVAYDLAQFWTTRNIDADGLGGSAGIIGLAYVGAVCGTFKYHILEDFVGAVPTGSGYQLRVLTSHEIGHNFGCGHDGAGSGFIMAPSVANTALWSPLSVATVDGTAPTYACLAACSAAGVPTANFITSPEGICTGGMMTLTDRSLNGPTSWAWTLTGGVPAASALRNPGVTYAAAGIKTISLTSTNGAGASTPFSKNRLVSAPPMVACSSPGVLATEGGVKSFSLNNINKSTGSSLADGSKYMDFACTDNTSLLPSTMYSATVNVGYFSPTDPAPPHIFNKVWFYIDYNNDGDFLDAGELVYSTGGGSYIGNHSFTFVTPAVPAFTDVFLRARVIASEPGSVAAPCHVPVAGQVEDYSVFFPSTVLLSVSKINLDGYHFNGANILNWQTVEEKDNNYYEVERSTDGTGFSAIGRVNAKPGSNNAYTFNDPLSGSFASYSRLYYRLRIVGMSGSVTYSKIVPITINNQKNEILLNLHPNPFTNAITATIQLNRAGTVQTQLMDLAGRIVYQNARNLPAGINTVTYNDFENLAKGAYLIKISCQNETITRLIEKQ